MKFLVEQITTLKEFLLDLILPQRKRVRDLESMSAEEVTFYLSESKNTDISYAEAVIDYREKTSRELVWQLKYKGNRKIAKTLAEIMYDKILASSLKLSPSESSSKPLLIPIPLTKKKKRVRGFNQTEILSEEIKILDKENLLEYQPKLLKKTRETKNQTSIRRRSDRLKNLRDCFEVKNTSLVKNRSVIIIDDVITTGSTIKEARKALKKAGAKKVVAFAVAH